MSVFHNNLDENKKKDTSGFEPGPLDLQSRMLTYQLYPRILYNWLVQSIRYADHRLGNLRVIGISCCIDKLEQDKKQGAPGPSRPAVQMLYHWKPYPPHV
ncbi:hypothetical protein AVEN_87541-1 [Araneus ventricosus]|uniref:Uncharacterized protein n=1 Tax=Araneus ventricosus TaxID=182803 RepID=A0A4Y2TER8_ARAVE|nr:hypothetical protein AVEN_87541-1 [Araneus ventricosus]